VAVETVIPEPLAGALVPLAGPDDEDAPAAPHAARTAAAARVKMMRRIWGTSAVIDAVSTPSRYVSQHASRYPRCMCRSIKTLRGAEPAADDDDARAAALQFVRKISGYRAPSKMNQPAFDAAVQEVTAATTRLLDGLQQQRA
jgi:hypothetical protein